jgi:predicted PurR-regulated permease PerM
MRYLPHMHSDGTMDAPSPDAGTPASPAVGRSRPDLRTLHLWQLQPVRDVLVIAAIAGTVYAGYAIRTVTIPLLVALLLAYLCEPVVARLTRSGRMGRPMAVSVIFGALTVLLGATLGLAIPLAVGQTISFGNSLRSGKYDAAIEKAVGFVPEEYRSEVREWTDRIIHPRSVNEAQALRRTTADDTPADDQRDREPQLGGPATEASAGLASEPAGSAWSIDRGLLSLLGVGSQRVYAFSLFVLQIGLVAFLIPFYFYYFSVHWPSIVGFLRDLVPSKDQPRVFEIAAEMDRAVAGFVRGRIVICVAMGVMFAIGWQLCGVPYGIALGLLIGAFSIVPYLGGIGVPVAIGLLVADQFSLEEAERMSLWGMLLWPTLVFVVVQSIEGYVLTPIIAGKATNLDPVTIVVAILAGGTLAGVYGMLLAIPIAACGKIAASRLLLPRVRAWAQGRASDPLPINHN